MKTIIRYKKEVDGLTGENYKDIKAIRDCGDYLEIDHEINEPFRHLNIHDVTRIPNEIIYDVLIEIEKRD